MHADSNNTSHLPLFLFEKASTFQTSIIIAALCTDGPKPVSTAYEKMQQALERISKVFGD